MVLLDLRAERNKTGIDSALQGPLDLHIIAGELPRIRNSKHRQKNLNYNAD
jgi:hypothetical protein